MNSIKKFEDDLSESAYNYCLSSDDPFVRQYITHPFDSYRYCKFVKDREEIKKNIVDSYIAYRYCKNVKDDPLVRQYIKDSIDSYLYCKFIKDRTEIRKNIIDPSHAYDYCTFVRYREELAEIARKGGYDI